MNIPSLTDIDGTSRALAHLVFRNGVVEDMHVAGKLSSEDMKALNKDVHNRIAGLLLAAKEGKDKELAAIIGFAKLYGQNEWDECQPMPLDVRKDAEINRDVIKRAAAAGGNPSMASFIMEAIAYYIPHKLGDDWLEKNGNHGEEINGAGGD